MVHVYDVGDCKQFAVNVIGWPVLAALAPEIEHVGAAVGAACQFSVSDVGALGPAELVAVRP